MGRRPAGRGRLFSHVFLLVMWEYQYYCERYREIVQEDLLITFSIWGLFSIGKKRWKADDELFPARLSDP